MIEGVRKMDYSVLIEPDEITNEPYIFVSYSRQDMDSVQSVIKILKENHFRFWYDKGLKSGIEWAEELGDKIDQCDQFLVLISSNSVKSKYVRKEIGMATDRDKNILVLYLEETNLTSGLHLLLGNIQAIHKESFSNENDFAYAICKAASNNTLYQNINVFDDFGGSVSGAAKSELLMNYRLLSKLGSGGLSRVFLAEHKRTGVLAAVKCGLSDKTYRGSVLRACFNTERKVLTEMMQNMCPYTPTILDWFEDDTQVFIVETLIHGESLKSKTFYTEDEVVAIAKKVLNILQYLHGSNIVYRDIKPSNLIRDRHGEIHLIDFNTAMVVEESGLEKEVLVGTVGFAPPEQFDASISSNFSTDIYGLGRTMEYLLCPKQFDKNIKIPIRYYRKDVSVELEAILKKMTASSQNDRYQNVGELLCKLNKYKSTNILNKVLLLIKSWRDIKAFEDTYKKYMEERKNFIHEIAVDLREIPDETVMTGLDVQESTENNITDK